MRTEGLKRLENETEYQYIVRVCGYKDKYGWTWTQVANVLNHELQREYDESSYRKKYQNYKNLNESLTMQEEKYKVSAVKGELNRMLRQKSRFEFFYENVGREIQTLPPPSTVCNVIDDACDVDKEYVLTIADIQCGAEFDLEYNSYSLSEVQRRFDVLLSKIRSWLIRNGCVRRLHVVSLGDTIQGILRLTDLKLNETSVVSATVFVARALAGFLNALSSYVYIEYYHTPTSNHSQIRPLGSKASELASEDIEYIIGNYIKDVLKDNKRININLNFGSDYIRVPIFNFNVVALHGHTIKNVETALKDLSDMHGVLLDYILIGHFHNGRVIAGNERNGHDTAVLMCSSFQGTDPYAYNKLGKSSKAACQLFEFDKQDGCDVIHKFILN